MTAEPQIPARPHIQSGPGDPTVVNKSEARQGETSGRMRMVLIVGLIGVIIAFVAAYAIA